MGLRFRWVVISLAPVLAAAGQPAPQPQLRPMLGERVDAFDHRSPTAWLARAVSEWKAIPAETDSTVSRVPSPLMLIALGQATSPGAELEQTFALLRMEAAAGASEAGKAFAYVRLAMFPHPAPALGNRVRLLHKAIGAAAEMEADSLKPLVDLEVLTALARTGDFKAAEELARATADARPKAAQYCALAMAAGEKGDRTACGEYLRAARRLTTDQDDETVSVILLKIGQVQAAFGDDHGVRLTVETIPSPRWQIDLLAELARRQRAAGNTPGYTDSLRAARESAEKLPAESRLTALLMLAGVQVDASDSSGAREIIATARQLIDDLPSVRSRVTGQLELAIACARAGDAQACIDLLTTADTERSKLPSTVAADASSDDDNDPFRRQAVTAIAALARAGQVDTAETLAKPFLARSDRNLLDWALCEARAGRGHIEDAVAHFDQLTSPAYRAWAARRIAEASTARGQFASLDAFVARLSPAERAWADLGAAEGLAGQRVTDKKNSEFCQLGVD